MDEARANFQLVQHANSFSTNLNLIRSTCLTSLTPHNLRFQAKPDWSKFNPSPSPDPNSSPSPKPAKDKPNSEVVLTQSKNHSAGKSISDMSFAITGFPIALKLNASLVLPPVNGSVSGGSTSLEISESAPMKLISPGYKWRLLIAYDGTKYAGWQYQASPPTIQCILEDALTKITKLERKELHLVGASRTDAGVHALGQVAHFVTPFKYDSLDEVHSALNGLLPEDIRVREISAPLPEFHARFSAKGKIYHYKIFNGAVMDPFQRHYAYHSVYKLNASVMREAAMHYVGEHDFSSFVNASRDDRIRDPVKKVCRFDINEMGDLLQLEVEGSGFLFRQVRNMVALLMQIGREAVPPNIVPKILACRDRRVLATYALSAPPHGLCLMEVKYKEDHLELPQESRLISLGRRHTIRKCKIPFF